jgi:spore coat polysaccharide biosynthesis protein SpsF
MESTRLPGKILMDLAGEPILVRCMNRVRRASFVDDVLVATTDGHADDVVATLCAKRNWSCFRGSEDDVLDRYYRAALSCRAEVVVRVTSDCPFIEPEVIDRVLREFHERGPAVDYVSNFIPRRTFPRGLDVETFSFAALERAWNEDKNPAWREHVTEYMLRNPDRFMLRGVLSLDDLSHWRWTVDTPEDLSLARLIYESFRDDRFSWREVLALLADHPDWADINRGIRQKSIE